MFRFNKIKNSNQGQTIIEAVVALTTLVLVLSSISVAIITSLNNAQFIKSQGLASKYAQQGIEYLRYIRNNDPATFESLDGVYCFGSDNVVGTAGGCSPGPQHPNDIIDGQFKRQIEFTRLWQISLTPTPGVQCSAGTKVAVVVYWSDPKCSSSNTFCHSSQLDTCLSKESSLSIPK